MNPLILSFLTTLVPKLIEKVFPDPQQAAKAKLEWAKMQQEGFENIIDANAKIDADQSAINLQEAKSENFFMSGWRPLIGWTSGGLLMFYYVVYFGVSFYFWIVEMIKSGHVIICPASPDDLIQLL